DRIDLTAGRQRHGASNPSAGALGVVHNLACRSVESLVVVGFHPNSNLAACHDVYVLRKVAVFNGERVTDTAAPRPTQPAAANRPPPSFEWCESLMIRFPASLSTQPNVSDCLFLLCLKPAFVQRALLECAHA